MKGDAYKTSGKAANMTKGNSYAIKRRITAPFFSIVRIHHYVSV